MALQHNVLENGEWVTRTLEAQELFRQTSASSQARPKKQPSMPPDYGILTKTVIESPIIQRVLPAQLRSPGNNDVAFIGDNFVQICELGRDAQLQDVIKKQDFGSRIRNAIVIGSPVLEDGTQFEIEDDDIEMVNSTAPDSSQLPPQFLALVLECGDLVFLYLKDGEDGESEFVSSSFEIPNSRLVCPGFHMAVDPSSRYLTLACSENLYLVFELESMDTLRLRHLEGRLLEPIKSVSPRAVIGVIHKIDFLYPNPDDDYHVILILVIIRDGVSRVVTYDWEVGDDLRAILSEEKRGHRLEPRWQMPLLIIPITVRNCFFIITENDVAALVSVMNGPLDIETCDLGDHEDTDLHIGNHRPLWTAWARPFRLPTWHRAEDVIYLAREDGILKFLELGVDSGVKTSVTMRGGEVNCNVDTAFACLYHRFSDILITGGDSGPGAIWTVEARGSPRQIGTIPNWSPTVDIATTHIDSKTALDQVKTSKVKRQLRPDRIFACSGRGMAGSLAEYRYGLEVKINYEMDLRVPVRKCWTIECPADSMEEGTHILVALPNRSTVLHLTENLSQAEEKNQDSVPYDLASTTLAAQEFEDVVVQVTTSSITIITPTESTRHLAHEVDDDFVATIADAAIEGHVVALALHTGSHFRLKTLDIDGLDVKGGPSFDVDGEVTCLALGNFAGKLVMLAGIWDSGRSLLAIYPIHDSSRHPPPPPVVLDLQKIQRGREPVADTNSALSDVEALTSIVLVGDELEKTILCVGTKSGEVFTLSIDPTAPQDFRGTCDKFGLSGAHVIPLSTGAEPHSVFVCCDLGLTVMGGYSSGLKPRFERKLRLWATGISDTVGPALAFNAAVRMRRSPLERPGSLPVVVTAGTVIYVSELMFQPKPILRHIPVHGTPVKVMYSHRLNALVVGVSEDGRPSLRFIDPDTGLDVSTPTDSGGQPIAYINGLGEDDTKILSLTEWRQQRGANNWEYIVVSLKGQRNEGVVLIISAKNEVEHSSDGSRRIHFFTKYKRASYSAPIWSIATEAQGLFICAGTMIHYEVLDMERKKLRKVKEHELTSPASWMEVVDGSLHVVTTRHSLEILDYKTDPEDDTMTRIHSDDRAKNSVHCMEAVDASKKGNSHPVTLLSDMHCGVWGLWVPPQDGRPLKTVFEAELQSSVRKFARARARPQWDSSSRQMQYGCIRSSADGSDILGLGIDGSLQHFTVLHIDAWRLLRFIQNLALFSRAICPFTHNRDERDEDWSPEPQRMPVLGMQIDGDMLQRCLDKRALEGLMSQPDYMVRFRQLLDALESGRYTQSIQEGNDKAEYFELAYDILKYYLSPVF